MAGNTAQLNVMYVSGPAGVVAAEYPLGYDASTRTITIDAAYFSGVGGGVTYVNGISGVVNILGINGVSVTNAGQNITISGVNLANSGDIQALSDRLGITGSYLYDLIVANSGGGGVSQAQLDATGALIDISSGTLSQQIASTGSQVLEVANANAVNLSGDLTLTGQILQGRIDSVSGWTENVVSGGLEARIAQTGAVAVSYAVSIGTSTSGTIAQTGQAAVAIANANALNLSGNLTQTGIALGDSITLTGAALIGYANGMGSVLSGNLAQTGTILNDKINALSGSVASSASLASTGQQLYNLIVGGDTNLSGNLAQTGSTLDGRITSLSGFTLNASGALQNQISAGNGTQVRVTGSSTLSIADLTGIGGTVVLISGGQVLISGGAGGGAGVSSLNGLTNAVTLLGTGGLTVSVNGQNILVSGDSSISGALTQTGSVLNNKVNALSGFVGEASGGLEVRLGQTGAASMGYSNSVGTNLSGALTQTGVALGLTVASTGAAAISYTNSVGANVSGSLTQTGVALGTTIASTGSAAVNHANGIGSILSGNLTQTGVALGGKIDALSGYAASSISLASTGQQLYNLIVGGDTNLSGNLYQTGAALLQLIGASSAGVSSLNGSSGILSLVGAGDVAISTNGQTITISGTGATLAQLAQTGSTLDNKVNALSGYSASAVNLASTGSAAITAANVYSNSIGTSLSGNLTQTGVTLGSKIDALSGSSASAANLASTGQQLYNLTVGVGTNISGNLTLTGQTLGSKVDSVSGWVGNVSGGLQAQIAQTGNDALSAAKTYSNSVGSIISGNLTQTGVALGGKVDSLSGFVGNVSGGLEARIAQTGTAAVAYANTIGLNVSGNMAQTGATLIALVISTGNAAISHANGMGSILSGNITATGSTLWARDLVISGTLVTGIATSGSAALNAAISYANSVGTNLSGNLTQTGVSLGSTIVSTGTAAVNHANGIGTVLSGNLTLTGQTLQGRIDSVSGWVGNVSGGLEVRIFQTGAAAVTASTTYANSVGSNLSGNLTQTGVALISRDLVISGTLVTGIASSGSAALSAAITYANSVGTNLSGNLTQTGVALGSKIDSLSGFVGLVSGGLETRLFLTGTTALSAAQTYANNVGSNLSGNLTQTGATLQTRITSLSGFVGNVSGGLETRLFQTGAAAITAGATYSNSIGTSLSGNLTLTGSTLWQRDIDISGAIMVQVAGGGSVVKVSGSAAIATADFTGIGGTLVFTSGGQVFISGAASSAPGGGVPSVNGISTAVGIYGTGGLSAVTIGSNIYLSGFVNAGSGQLTFRSGEEIRGDANLVWDYSTGMLEIGQPQLNYVDNPLSIGGSGGYLQANIRNRSLAVNASADWVATSDVGRDVSGYINLGINNSQYAQTAYDIGSGNDGYLYVNGGNLDIGTQTTGNKVVFHTAGTRYYNVRAIVDDSGIMIPVTGILRVGPDTTGSSTLTSTSLRLGLGTISGIGVAGKPGLSFSSTGWGNTYYQSAFWDNKAKFFGQNNAATLSIWGDTAANVGTLANTTSEVLGDYTLITPAAGLSAGIAFTNANIFRGTTLGLNGFFFTAKFLLTSVWSSGLATSTYGAPSGCRIFVGLTDQAVATQVGLNEPAGNMIGLNYLWASGGAVGTGQYMQNWAIRSRNNVATSTGTTTMSFQTGFYRFSMYCPPWPNNTSVNWELRDVLRGSGINGSVSTNLPVGSTAMRPMVALGFVSGIKTIAMNTLYVEKQGSLID